ncbi:MAG: hypothetical protein V4659_04375 [Pseudomonadota bacterium]
MSENAPETPEQAATRRRWITLAELVGVAGVLIAGISLYLSWQDRREERAEREIAKTAETRTASVISFAAKRVDDGKRLELADPAHRVDAITVSFPITLGVATQEALVAPRIEARWFDDALLKATKAGGDKQTGRLPVLIAASFWEGEAKRTDRAIYDLVWRSEGGGLFGGRSVKLDGLLLRERRGTQARLDALWKVPS